VRDHEPTPTWDPREFRCDGTRVIHFPGDQGIADVTLVFGVGQRDETLTTLGTLHALEHLVMDSVRRTPIEINASVGHSFTAFTAKGSPGLVAAFLVGVCQGLADPPLGRLGVEAKILAAEGPDESGTELGPARFGMRDLGLLGAPGPGPGAVTPANVQAMTGWFVSSNCILLVDGSLPEDLRLPLPTDPRPDHHYVTPRRWAGPHAVSVEGPACAVNLILPPPDGTGVELLARAVILERFTEVLRHQRGLTYDLDHELAGLVDGCWALEVLASPPPERAVEAVRAMIETTQDLLARGPSEAEFHHARALVLESSRGRDAEISNALDVAISDVLGVSTAGFNADAVLATTQQRVTDFLRGLGDDALYLVDERAEPELAALNVALTQVSPTTLGPLPQGKVFRPPLLALATSREARASRVVLTNTGLAHQMDSRVQRIAWSGVAGVLRQREGDVVVFGLDGSAIPVGPNLYRNGIQLIEALQTQVHPELIYDDPDPDDGESAFG
jgi:hypothetical protein